MAFGLGNVLQVILGGAQTAVNAVINWERSTGGQLLLPRGTSDPTTDQLAGEVFLRTDTGELKYWDGAAWQLITATPGGSIDHGGLTGLTDDDHTQYLLANGSRALTGPMSAGNNALTNVASVNGVVVENHGSRHLPDNADGLAVGVPSSLGTANAEGTANAFARQDHVHASPVFGRHFALMSSDTVVNSTVAQPSFTTAHSFTYNAVEAGTYLIAGTYLWSANTTATDFISRVVVDGTDIVSSSGNFQQQEPSDSEGDDSGTGSGTNQRFNSSFITAVTFATSGNKNVEILIAKSSTGTSVVTLYLSRISMWRVG